MKEAGGGTPECWFVASVSVSVSVSMPPCACHGLCVGAVHTQLGLEHIRAQRSNYWLLLSCCAGTEQGLRKRVLIEKKEGEKKIGDER